MPTSDKPRRAPATTKSKPPRSRLRLSVQHAVAAAGLPARSTLRRWIICALASHVTAVSMTLRFVGAAEGRRLNREFRQSDHATNVLTFVYDSTHQNDAKDALAGDLVLCVPVLKREARTQRKSLRAHCAHLVIHGTLHLQGYDHDSDKDATVMEALETRLLATLGYSDPYDETRNASPDRCTIPA